MKIFLWFSVLCIFLWTASRGAASDQGPLDATREQAKGEGAAITLKIPLFSPQFSRFPVAVVNGDPITVEEFAKALASLHEGRPEGQTSSKKDFARALQRLVNTKLIVLEARTMGMDELPEVKGLVDSFSKTTLRSLLRQRLVKDVKADEAEVERVYRGSIKEYKLRSLMFKSEEDARSMAAAVAAGAHYEELAEKAVADGRAQGNREAEYVRAGDLDPKVTKALSRMQAGSVSQPIPIKPGFVVFILDEIRYAESPEGLDQARRDVLTRAQQDVLVKHNKALSRKYLTFNMKLIDRLDFGAEKPGMEALLKDTRVIVRVKGEPQVTVGDLATALEEKFYHGTANASKKRINRRKLEVLEELLAKRLLLSETKRQGLAKTDEYKNAVKKYEHSVLFGIFVEKVIKPEVKLSREELKAYYDQHAGEYLSSPRMKIDSLAFTQKREAQDALDKLARGTDLRWLREHAPGQAGKDTPGVPEFRESWVAAGDLPEEINKALAGVRTGEARLAPGPKGHFYVLYVHEVTPPNPLSFEEVQGSIAKKAYPQKIESAIDEWARKLSASYDVKIYLTENEPHTAELVRGKDAVR